MQSTIIQIGNSKGVRIPKPLLEESGLSKNVEIKAKKGMLTITPIKDNKKSIELNEEYVLSLSSLAKDWDSPEEDKAWESL